MRQIPLQAPLLWISYLLFWICGVLAALWPVPGFLCGALLLMADRRLWKFPRLALCLILCGLACACALWHMQLFEDAIQNPPEWVKRQNSKNAPQLSAKVVSSEWRPGGRLRVLLADVRPVDCPPGAGIAANQCGTALPGLCMWTWVNPEQNPLPGQSIRISRPIRPIHGVANSSARSYEASWAGKNVYWRIWSSGQRGNPVLEGDALWHVRIRQRLRALFLRALLPENQDDGEDAAPERLAQAKAILLALMFGDRSGLSQNSLDNFASATLAHSLALSGQHLCVAGFLALLLVLAIARQSPAIYLSWPKKILIAFVTLPLAFIYLWIGDAPASLMRAFCMILILALWLWQGAIFSILDLLAGALVIILLFQPLAILDAGLQMSALCIAVIAISLPSLGRIRTALVESHKFSRWVMIRAAQIFMTSLVIQFSLMPVSLARFQNAGLWFPLNLFWLPVLEMAVLPLAALGLMLTALSFLFGLGPARLVLDIAALPCAFLLEKLGALRGLGILGEPSFLLPHWSVFPAFASLALGLAWLFGSAFTARARTLQLLILGLLLLVPGPALRLGGFFSDRIELEALDVGQGMATYIGLPGGCRMLVDGGGNFSSSFDTGKILLAPALSDNARPELAAVINTHPDMDHLGGLFYIMDSFSVGNIFHNGREATKDTRERWLAAQKTHDAKILYSGDRLIPGKPDRGFYLELLHPPQPVSGELADSRWSGNGASLVMRLCKDGEGLALITGDAEISTLKYLLSQEIDLKAKVLFLPHHGSDRSFLPEFYEKVSPAIGIASCGFQNRWNYPGDKIKNWFAKNDIPLLDTGSRGRISLALGAGNEIAINTARK